MAHFIERVLEYCCDYIEGEESYNNDSLRSTFIMLICTLFGFLAGILISKALKVLAFLCIVMPILSVGLFVNVGPLYKYISLLSVVVGTIFGAIIAYRKLYCN